ncbi:hypothetical protein BDN72DRAFT_813704 [Pluteus cervinus]|uniref:Uncharacterized protein n=1 Tax=Pluteus cervinus TaxID=181527 RepID=A0ACD3B888_9AGAR|nr:hypothetical protein BDN72DRAFT_813704 [Pluteus cervinus]
MADAIDWNLLAAYGGLIALATGSIYTGSHGSLPVGPHYFSKNTSVKAEEHYEDIEVKERVTSDDAWLFPIMGSVVLFGMYTAFKYFGTEWINWFLGWYFAFTSVGSTWRASISFVRYLIGPTRWNQFDSTKLMLSKVIVASSCRTPTLILLPLSTWPSLYYTLSSTGRKSILLTNVLSLCFSFNALTIIKLDSFKTGVILLSALLIYDVFWVFKTDVMLSVATNMDLPIKLSWPKDLLYPGKGGYMMLGLGDIIVPGLFVALGLRYDFDRAQKKNPGQRSFSKPYFHTMLVAYVGGLVTTMVVLHVFKAAQPALLYLSPACIISLFLTAVVRGEFKDVWSWSDDPLEGGSKADASKPSKMDQARRHDDIQDNNNGHTSAVQTNGNDERSPLRNR